MYCFSLKMSICLEQESCCSLGYWKQCFYYVCSNVLDLKQTNKKFSIELLHSTTNGGDGVLL